jgi:two-component system, sensor histidine kinase YesM
MKIVERIKMRNVAYSLRTQLILFFTVFSLGVLAVGYYFTYIYTMNIIKSQNEINLLQKFRESEYNISNLMNETDRLLKLFLLEQDLVKEDYIQQFLQTNNYDQTYEATKMHKAILSKISNFMLINSKINSIYFFTQNNSEIGRNAENIIIIRAGEQKIDFFSSDIYKNLMASNPKMVWDGGYKEKYFNPQLSDGGDFLISEVREVKAYDKPDNGAMLVFNINERDIASIYASISDSKAGNMFIMDEAGRIISSGNGENIGEQSPVISNIRTNAGAQKDYGSFMSKREKNSIQIVYYKLKNTKWYLVGEIPLNLFSGDIAVLQRILLLVFVSSIFIIFAVSFFWLKKITEPLNLLAVKMRDMSSGKLGLTFHKIPRNELGLVIKRFNEMSLSIVELIRKNEGIQEEKRKLEIEALQSQINPHFIYNTLNMIKWMAAMTKSKNIVESIVSLGNILRPAFKSMDKMCSLQDEIEYIGNYFKIMNLRYGNGIHLEFHIPDILLKCKVPRFILQPVVENSIIHGMKRPENCIDINIDVFEESNILYIIVLDTGNGIEKNKLEEINNYLSDLNKEGYISDEGSIGLYNVNRRICLNFGNQFGIKLESLESEGARVLIKLPVII